MLMTSSLPGLFYYEGRGGIETDERKGCGLFLEAVPALQKLAKEGHPTALWNLGDCYYNGYHVVESEDEAINMYRKAALAGHRDG